MYVVQNVFFKTIDVEEKIQLHFAIQFIIPMKFDFFYADLDPAVDVRVLDVNIRTEEISICGYG